MESQARPVSGQLRIDKNGKLFLSGEVFDNHGTYQFEAGIDTGSGFGFVMHRDLADAVCAPVIRAAGSISIGAGSSTISGVYRKVNFRFGGLEVRDYEAVVLDGSSARNIIGVKFFQDAGMLLLADFHEGSAKGGLVTSDRRSAEVIGKTLHCFAIHNLDLSKCLEPCPVCGQTLK